MPLAFLPPISMRRALSIGLIVFCVAFGGCGSSRVAPVRDEARSVDDYVPAEPSHEVRKGDTLYSIAWRYGLDFNELASWNGIRPPYKIHVGQLLVITPTRDAKPTSRKSKVATRKNNGVGKQSESPLVLETAEIADEEPISATNGVKVAPGAGKWTWPTRGAIVRAYDPRKPGRRGIHIAGRDGQPVTAAAPGRVVYSGNGLAGYGNLVIIKHDTHYLSAYGYNRRLLVREGDAVAAHQKIAEMGVGAGSAGILYFEIRRDGKPVDPLRFLAGP